MENFKGITFYPADDESGIPYPIMDLTTDFMGIIMTFIFWTNFWFVMIPAATFDWFSTWYHDKLCKTTYGEEWEAWSEFAAGGRVGIMIFYKWWKPCVNPY